MLIVGAPATGGASVIEALSPLLDVKLYVTGVAGAGTLALAFGP